MRSLTFEKKLLHKRNSHVGHLVVTHGSIQIRYVGHNCVKVNLFVYLTEGIRFST